MRDINIEDALFTIFESGVLFFVFVDLVNLI